ncbi:uncharacterized protein LOC113232586 [Hyposmocoma kahamanoa]|uniref:uncharacterized protein LOC113232586 n=1 Tax=Hyposmocoma kahamanoa TaxID=1477025 RepID=UPI000E6D794F|nr:uncharacterized protein LOC113232586 [Hyposmocoma kahamanoa]
MDENEDDIIAAFGHILLAGVATKALGTTNGTSFTHPGMHANYLLHGLTGGFHFVSKITGLNVQPVYRITKMAVQYLALPSLMADLNYENKYISVAHFATGLLPFAVAVSGNDSPHLSNFAISVNVISLCYYAIKHTCHEYAWYTAGSALVTYFGFSYVNMLFPIGLAITEFLAHKLYYANFGPPPTKEELKEAERKKKEEEKKKKEAEKKKIEAEKAAKKQAMLAEKAKEKEKAKAAAEKKAKEKEKDKQQQVPM